MQNEILKPVLATDETAIPRYDIVNPDGSVAQQNVELRLKNEVMQQGTPYDEESVLPATLCEKLGLPNSATPANAFEAVLAKAGAKVSMNEPTSQDNIAAGYSTGAMWLRPYYTLTNMVYALEASSITTSACTVNKSGQTFTVAGNGDDKVISVSYTMPTNNGWLYAVVTPDSTASSATIVVGDKTVELTPGNASTVCVQFTGTALQVSATYSTANTASSGTIEIKNLTVLDNAATVVQCVDSEQDITVASIQAHCDANAPYSAYNVPSKLFQQTHDGVWEVTYDSNSYTNQDIIADDTKALFGLSSDAVPDDALTLIKHLIDSNYSNLSSMVNSRAKIVTGSYTGTGTYGGDKPNHLTFNEEPFLVFLYAHHWSDNWGQIPRDAIYSRIMMIPQFLSVGRPNKNNVLGFSKDGGDGCGWKSNNGKTIYWYSSSNASNQYNYSGYVYYYMAIYK